MLAADVRYSEVRELGWGGFAVVGALVFVATPLYLVSIAFYLRRVLSELSDKNLL